MDFVNFTCEWPKLLPSHTGNSRRSRRGHRSVANQSQSITGQSEAGCKCIMAVGPRLSFWGLSSCRLTWEWHARVVSLQACRGAVANHSYYLVYYTFCLLVCQSPPDIDVNANLWSGDKSSTIVQESKKSRIFQLVNRLAALRCKPNITVWRCCCSPMSCT